MKIKCSVTSQVLVAFITFVALMSACPLANADSILTVDQRKAIADEVKTIANENAKAAEEPGGENDKSIINKYFGAGIMANVDLGGKKTRRVKSARVVGGVVRVEEESKAQIGFMLEAHKFISDVPDSARQSVHGPFIGLVMSGEGAIDTAILGYMWGFRQPKTTQTLNLGFGLSITPKAQVLGDGIIEGQPLPNGETEVRYKNTTKYGATIIASFGF